MNLKNNNIKEILFNKNYKVDENNNIIDENNNIVKNNIENESDGNNNNELIENESDGNNNNELIENESDGNNNNELIENENNNELIENESDGNNNNELIENENNNELIENENNNSNNESTVKSVLFSNNENNNIENVVFNNLGENNITTFISGNQNIIVEEEIAIKESSLIYKDDNIYLKELENQLLSEYPISKQGLKFIQKDVQEVAKKLIEVKNIGIKNNYMHENGIEYGLINDIINDNFDTSNWIIPVVLDKHRIYSKLKEKDTDGDADEDESNVFFSESVESKNGVIEENQKTQMLKIKKLDHDYNLSKLTLKSYLNQVRTITNSYYAKYNESNKFENVGSKRIPNEETLVLRYSDINNINWNSYYTNNKYSYSRDVLDEQGKIKGLEESVLIKGDEINVIGFMLLANAGENILTDKDKILAPKNYPNFLSKAFRKVGNISKIYNSGNSIIIEIKNHGIVDKDIIYLDDTNSFPRINYTFGKSIKVIDSDKIAIESSIKILIDGTSGTLYTMTKLEFDLYEISKNQNELEINFKESSYKEKVSIESNSHNKLFLFNSFNIEKDDYEKIIKKIMPSIDTIIKNEIVKINNSYTFNDVNNIIKNYNLNINNLPINEVSMIKEILERNLEKLINQKSNKLITLNFNKNTKKYFKNNDYFLSDFFINNADITKIYGKYLHLNKPEDNIGLRLKWIESQKDNGKLYYLNVLLLKYNEFKNNYNIKYISDKIDELNKLHNEIEKNFKKEKNINNKNKSSKIYKYQAYIVSDKDAQDGFKNLKSTLLDNTVIFYKDNLFMWKDGKKTEFKDLEENTMALVDDSIYIWQKNEWYKSDAVPKYDNIKYLCELNNIDINNIKLDSLQSIYRDGSGCYSKLYYRFEESYMQINEYLEKFRQLESYIKNDDYLSSINNKIASLKIKYYSSRLIETINVGNKVNDTVNDTVANTVNDAVNDAVNDTVNDNDKNDLLSKLIKMIFNINNYYLKLEFIYNLIEKDGLLIGYDIYSKKYNRKMGICGHYYYFKKINYADNADIKTDLINEMVSTYSDGGESEKESHVCKNCGEFLIGNEYDDTEGFSESGSLKKSREIWKFDTIKSDAEEKDLVEYMKDSIINITTDDRYFKEVLLKFGLSINDVDEALSISTFITKNLYSKSGVTLPNTELINVIIDCMQKIKTIIPYSIFKSKEIKKYKDKGLSIPEIEGKDLIKDAYLKYLKLRKSTIITSRFLISIQTAIPELIRSSKTTVCPFYSFNSNEGIEYMACILEEMKVVLLKDKTKSFEILKVGLEESYKDLKQLTHIKEFYKNKQIYDTEMQQKKDELKFTEEDTFNTELIEPEKLSTNYEKTLENTTNITDFYKLKNELMIQLNYFAKKIKRVVGDYIGSSALSDAYSGVLETSCCTEYADKFIDYYFQIELESNIPLKKIIDESVQDFNYTQYFVTKGSIHRFILYDPRKFDGIHNRAIVDDQIHTSESLIKAVFEVFVDKGIYTGTMREYSGNPNNLIDIKTGLTKKEILEKNYTIQEYQTLLKNIESHNIKYYTVNKRFEFEKSTLDKLKKESEIDKLNKEIDLLVKNVVSILNKPKESIPKYIKLLRNFSVTEINKNEEPMTKREIIKANEQNNKNKLSYIKNFYITKLKKYISIIKNGRNKSNNNVNLKFMNKDPFLLEIQSEIYNDNKKLEIFLSEDIRNYFVNLEFDYTNEEINSINGVDNIYDSKFEKIKKYSDFNFIDASNVLLHILISQLNKFIITSITNKKIDENEIYDSEQLYKNNNLNKKCKYICEFIMILINDLEEDEQIFNVCIGGAEGIKNSLIHDIIEYKSKLFNKEDDDDYFTKMMKIKLAPKLSMEEELAEGGEGEEVVDTFDESDKLEYILEKGKKELSEKLGYSPSEDELETYKEDYLKNMQDDIMYEEEAYDLHSTAMGKEVLDQGADYGGFNEYDFETGDGFDYSAEEYVE